MTAAEERGGTRHRFTVEAPEADTRIDKFLADRLAPHGISRSRIQDLLAQGRVSVEGQQEAPKASHRLQEGAGIEIVVPPPTPVEPEPEPIPLHILYEDAHLLVVDKPAGMVVHPARGNETGTLVNALLHHTELSAIGAPRRPGIVHRLDKGTTGLLVVAKDDPTHLALKDLFKRRVVEKVYLALVYGRMTPAEGLIDLPIGRSRRDRTKMAVDAGSGKAARTRYETETLLPGPFSLLRVTLLTGRTHQIRVHLADAGHPIVGDDKYAGERWRGLARRRLQDRISGLVRPFLHAHRLAFVHPSTGRRLELTSPLPADLSALLRDLREEDEAP